VTTIAVHHLADVEDKIARLIQLRDALGRIARLCDGGTVAECRIMETLSSDGRGSASASH